MFRVINTETGKPVKNFISSEQSFLSVAKAEEFVKHLKILNRLNGINTDFKIIDESTKQ